MEGNLCDVNHLESNSRLPPRKRLLVGLKNQNAAVYGNRHLSSSSSSLTFSPSSGFDVLINKWIGSQENNRSPEDIIEASMVAVKTAEAARSRAELKAAYAARAIDMAKEALEVSASIAEKFARRERRVIKKAKTMKMKVKKKKKQVQVQSVRILGRKPRQTKNSNSQSNVRNKRLKGKQIPENLDHNQSDELKSDGSSEETHSVGSDENNSPSISIRIDDINSGAETSSQLKKSGVQSLNISSRTGVKKSRFNQKNCPY